MRSDSLCRSVIQNMINAFAYHRIILDENGRPVDYEYLEVNKAFERMLGMERSAVLGRTIRQIAPDITRDSFDWIGFYGDIAVNGLSKDITVYSESFGSWFSINAYSSEKGCFVTIFTDISEYMKRELELEQKNEELTRIYKELSASQEALQHKNRELQDSYEELTALHEELAASDEELREQNKKLTETIALQKKTSDINKLVQSATNDCIWYYEFKTKKRMFSPNWLELTGFSVLELCRLGDWAELIHPDDKAEARELYMSHLEGKADNYNAFFRLRTRHGEYKWVQSKGKALFDNKGKPYLLAGAVTDISDIRKQQEMIEHLAYYDSLTNLPKRNLFIDRLNIAMGLANRNKKKVAVIFLDIDNFKYINDSMGHNIGDKLLISISKRLSKKIRKYESVSRFGGDEFAVLLQDISKEEDAIDFCMRLKEDLCEPIEFDGYVFHASASIGVTFYPTDGTDSDELLKNADNAMYRAKALGKNSIQVFQNEMKNAMLRRISIEKRLRKSLKKNDFKLCFQPQYNLETGTISSFEALIRWNDKDLGNVPPAEFIPIAESTGLIVPLGEWVLLESCKQAVEWSKLSGGMIRVSVNISAIQLKQGNFADTVKRILSETGLDPGLLELEITESMLIPSFDMTVKMLKELKEIGIRISMDDFGTGYSSLYYLSHLPLNTLKIDKSFISVIDTDSVEKEIAADIVSLVHNLHIDVVAEGVETENQLNYLKNCLCDKAQGFLLGKPADSGAVPGIIQRSMLQREFYFKP